MWPTVTASTHVGQEKKPWHVPRAKARRLALWLQARAKAQRHVPRKKAQRHVPRRKARWEKCQTLVDGIVHTSRLVAVWVSKNNALNYFG